MNDTQWRLSDDETRLVHAVAWGAVADFTARQTPPSIRADLVRRLLLELPVVPGENGRTERVTVVAGVRLTGAVLDGPLDLDEATADAGLAPLILDRCRLPDGLTARHAHFRRLALTDCATPHITLSGSAIDGDVDLSGLAALEPGAEGPPGECTVDMKGVRIDGSLTMSRVTLRLTPRPNLPEGERRRYALELHDAEIKGMVKLYPGLTADGGIRLASADIAGALGIEGAVVAKGEEQYSVQAADITVRDSVLLRAFDTADSTAPFAATGTVYLGGARIGGALELAGARLDGAGAEALNAQRANIGGSTFLTSWVGPDGKNYRCETTGTVSLMSAIVGGDLVLNGARLDGKGGEALSIQKAQIGGSTLLRPELLRDGVLQRFESTGSVTLMGARIDGSVELNGARLDGNGDHALNAQNAEIGEGINCSAMTAKNGSIERFEATGTVLLMGARLAGGLDLLGASLDGDGKFALHAQGMEVGKALLLRAQYDRNGKPALTEVVGEISLWGAEIKGKFDCRDADIGKFTARELVVHGDIDFRPNLSGQALFDNARIGGTLDLTGIALSPGALLSLTDVRVERTLKAHSVTAEGEKLVMLDGASCTTVDDKGATGWSPNVFLDLDGFTYSHLADHADIAPRRVWLERQFRAAPPNRANYSPQPYEQLARVLSAQGATHDARRILRDKAEIEMRLMPRRRSRWPYWLGFGIPFGYGLSVSRALTTFLLFIAAGTLLTAIAQKSGLLVLDATPAAILAAFDDKGEPSDAGIIASHPGSAQASQALVEVPCRDQITPWVYAADLAIPLLDLHEETRCTIRNPRASDPSPLESAAAFFGHPTLWRWGKGLYALFGWLVTSLTVLTIAGVFRRLAER